MALSLCILGSTGSIGRQTLDIVRQHPDEFTVHALTAHRNVDLLLTQCVEFEPAVVVCVDNSAALDLQGRLKKANLTVDVLSGADALVDVAADASSACAVAAIVGSAGLPSTFAAAKAGKRILLANKESLVMAGQLFMDAVRQSGAVVLPVDSEHNAIFQCLPGQYLPGHSPPSPLSHITLTASGGPFWNRDIDTFNLITPEEAVAHPNWSMGAKISVDSATMMNKGLEVIEAHWLFSLDADQIKVVIHPQSIIHSFVHFYDGSSLAQCGYPDMRVPIGFCLGWPNRLSLQSPVIEPIDMQRLDFLPPNDQHFPCLRIAYDALKAGPAVCIVLNVANEMAVADFLAGKLSYQSIARSVEKALNQQSYSNPASIDEVFALEQKIRSNWTSLSN